MTSHPRTAARTVAAGSGTATPTGTHGSQTLLQTNSSDSGPATLHLRAAEPAHNSDGRRRIQWAEDVVDNEGMGKKSSKVCCIYHKAHEPGDSESDDSSSDDGSDSEPDLSRARRAGGRDRGKARVVGMERVLGRAKGRRGRRARMRTSGQPKARPKKDG